MAQEAAIVASLQGDLIPGLSRIPGLLNGIVNGVAKVDKAVKPLSTGLTALLGGFVSLRTLTGTLKLAEEQAKSEERVLAALRGRRDALREVLRITERLRDATGLSDEALNDQAATLLSVGIGVDKLDDALRAASGTARALNLDISAVVRALGAVRGGAAPRISQQIPEIRDILESGGTVEQVIDRLNEKFGDFNEIIAESDFGRVSIALDKISDAGERVGTILNEVRVGVLEALARTAAKVDKALQLPAVKALVEVAKKGAPIIAGILVSLTGIAAIAATGAFLAFIAPVVAPLLAIAGTVATIATGLTGIVVAAAGLIAIFKDTVVVKAFLAVVVKIRETVAGIFSDLITGRLKLRDLFAVAETNVKNLFTLIDGFIIQPVQEFFSAIVGIVPQLLNVLVVGGEKFAVQFADLTQRAILNVVQGTASLLDTVLNALIDTANKIPGISLERSDLAGAIPDAVVDLTKKIKDLGEETDAAAIKVLNAIPNAVANSVAAGQTALIEIAKRNAELDADLRRRREQNQREIDEANQREVDALKAKNDKVLREIAGLNLRLADARVSTDISPEDLIGLTPDRIRTLFQSTAQAAREPLREAIQQELENQLKQQQIDTVEFFKLKEALVKNDLTLQMAIQEDLVEAQTDQVRLLEEIASIRRAEAAAAKTSVELQQKANDATIAVGVETERLLELERQRQETAANLLKADTELRELRRGLATGLLDELSKEREEAEKTIELIANLRESGAISPAEATSRSAAALEDFKKNAVEAQVELERLLAGIDPVVAEEFRKRIASLSRPPGQEALGEDVGLFGGISAGLDNATEKLSTFGELGKRIGGELATALGTGLIDALGKGGQAFNQFAAGVLKNLADMIAQTLIFRAIQFGLSFIPGGGAAAAAAPAVPGFAEGGEVPGPPVRRDVVPAMLMPREQVMDVDTVDHYGARVFEAMRRKLIPASIFDVFRSGRGASTVARSRFAEGGGVSASLLSSVAGRGGPGRAVVVSSEQELDRLFAGGEAAFLRMHDLAERSRGGAG